MASPAIMDCGAVAAGAIVGALLRHGASKLQAKYHVGPWGIAGVNVAGSFILGMVAASSTLSAPVKLLLGTGFCGSFTTFSTYSVDTVTLLSSGKVGHAVGYVVANNLGGVLAAAAGFMIVRGRLSPSAASAAGLPMVKLPSARAGASSQPPPAVTSTTTKR